MAPVMEVPEFQPIGVVRTGFHERAGTPRQPYVAAEAPGRIELYAGRQFEAALEDLDAWSHVWVIFWFHENRGWRPKVLPPRSPDKRRGVFATRSPHRPNPIGMSVLKLDRVVGRVLYVRGVDLLDGTPVLDIKPYVPDADIVPEATMGWLTVDPTPPRTVRWTQAAGEQTAWLCAEHGVDLCTPVERVLSLGTHPHPYRRIQRDGDALRLAVKDWRVRFRDLGETVEVTEVYSGYRPEALAPGGDAPAVHHAFVGRYPRGEARGEDTHGDDGGSGSTG